MNATNTVFSAKKTLTNFLVISICLFVVFLLTEYYRSGTNIFGKGTQPQAQNTKQIDGITENETTKAVAKLIKVVERQNREIERLKKAVPAHRDSVLVTKNTETKQINRYKTDTVYVSTPQPAKENSEKSNSIFSEFYNSLEDWALDF